MPSEIWGEHDYYFPGSGSSMKFDYEVRVSSSNAGEEATVSEARIYYATPPSSPAVPPDEAHALKKIGTGQFVLDMSSYAADTHSPLLIEFVFEKLFCSGPKNGNTEAPNPIPFGVVLAVPEVESIGASTAGKVLTATDAKPDEVVGLEVTHWGVRMFELPGTESFKGGIPAGRSTPELARFPAGYDADVNWQIDGAQGEVGPTSSYTVPADKLGHEVVVEAWRHKPDDPLLISTAKIAVPKLTIVGVAATGGGEVAAHPEVAREKALQFKVKLAPAGLRGTFTWSSSTDKLSLGDGKASSPTVEGDTVHVQGTAVSAAANDQKLKVVWTSEATGKTYEVEHALTVSKWPGTIKGKLFFNRTWDYKDETVPIAAVKEPLPGAKVELWVQKTGAAALAKHADGHLDDDGLFSFADVPAPTKLAVKVLLEHHGGKKVKLVGFSNAHAEADFECKTDQVIWSQVTLDPTTVGDDLDFKEVEITKAKFVELCDMYRSLRIGYERIKALTAEDLPQVTVKYPQDPARTSCHSAGTLLILNDDIKDRCVLLHEYGHYIDGKLGPQAKHPGYGFDDDPKKSHGRGSEEHYTAAWMEAWATFLACALNGDAHYHDGYDTTLNYKLDTDTTMLGPHSEGSIQEALWAFHKTHGATFGDIFKAWKSQATRKCDSAYAFYLNYKDLGLPKLAELVTAYKSRNMEFHYLFRPAYKAVAAADKDMAAKKFVTLTDLHTALGGTGTLADYKREFYNANKYLGGGALAAGSTIADPKVTVGVVYLAPERVKVS